MKVIRFPNSPFELHQPFEAAGDQPQAIKELVEGIEDGLTAQTLLGVTGSGKTYTMAEKDGYPSWNVASEPKQTPTVTVTAEDVEQCVKLTWTCELDETGLIRQHAEVTNTGEGRLEIGKIELAFSVPADANEILTTTGHHLRERSPQRQDFTIGRFAKSSMIGRPDFDATLLLSVGEHGFGFTHGNVYSAHVAWSGNSVLSAERLPYTTGVIGGGEVLFGGEVGLEHGESYTTPWLVGSYGEGLNEVASRFHGYIRRVHRDWLVDHGIAPKPRPVILNTWEAVYFNHDYDTLTALADKAVESGVERFVVDDGWFGARRDDTAGLGDWQISQDVWPDGDKSLKALADYVHGKGLEFGLWFEPEMVNPDSDMFRNHPDWVLKPTANRRRCRGALSRSSISPILTRTRTSTAPWTSSSANSASTTSNGITTNTSPKRCRRAPDVPPCTTRRSPCIGSSPT